MLATPVAKGEKGANDKTEPGLGEIGQFPGPIGQLGKKIRKNRFGLSRRADRWLGSSFKILVPILVVWSALVSEAKQ